MTERLQIIKQTLTTVKNLCVLDSFSEDEHSISFPVRILEGEVTLDFDVEILALYPMQFHDTETIRFINKELLEYDHVNRDGSICVHTLHSTQLSEKLLLDFESLRQWIRRYYIRGHTDTHYEHIVVSHQGVDGVDNIFLFTDFDYCFSPNEFGTFRYSSLAENSRGHTRVITHFVQSLEILKKTIPCKWSEAYRDLASQQGLFCFLKEPPVNNRRFAVDTWNQLESFVSQRFIHFLFSKYESLLRNPQRQVYVPLLLGYSINEKEIHWQAIIIRSDNFPITKKRVLKSDLYFGRFQQEPISWCQAYNCSYEYFFGRGKLCQELTNAKILVIGLGAIGSILAKSLVRGGLKTIYLVDYDLKEPANVCRSEYDFNTGIASKAIELHLALQKISPFVEVHSSETLMDAVKIHSNNQDYLKHFESSCTKYDFIFDCTTDNDVASLLDTVNIISRVFCLSITSEARELVCAVKPNLYSWMTMIFEKLTANANPELYMPNGCSTPTFKAGYTDVALMVHWAVKHINTILKRGEAVRSFVIAGGDESFFEPKLKQF